MSDLSTQAERTGRSLDDSDALDLAVRFGLAAYGVVYVLVGWLAVQLAFGEQTNASSTGALHTLARQPFGRVLVWAVAVGLFLLVIWRLLEALTGHRDEEGGTRLRKRLFSAVRAVVYGSIGVSAAKIAAGASSSSKGRSATARLMDAPAGQLLVGLVGVVIIGYGVSLAWRAWTEKFREHLSAEGRSGQAGRVYLAFGRAGYAAKGVAFAVIGGLFLYAAIVHEPKKSAGLDGALQEVLKQPFGQVLLVAMGLGIACYGLFNLARARHLSR